MPIVINEFASFECANSIFQEKKDRMQYQDTETKSGYSKYTDIWSDHIHKFAVEIGPRGPTTEQERAGHEYCRSIFTDLGYQVKWEEYKSAKSIFLPHLLASSAYLIAFLIYPIAGITSALVAA